MFVCNALNFASFDLESLFLVCRYDFSIFRSRSSGQGQSYSSKKSTLFAYAILFSKHPL